MTDSQLAAQTIDEQRFRMLLREARLHRRDEFGGKELAYVRLKKQVADLLLDCTYEQRIAQLCEALDY